MFSHGDYSYWFNNLSRSFFRVSKELGEKISAMMEDQDYMSGRFPALSKKLKDGGFIIDDDIDEYARAIELYRQEVESKHYMLTVIPTLNCNFKCHYCIQNHIPSIMGNDVIEKIFRHIDFMIGTEKIESLSLEWFGGEPFMTLDTVVPKISLYAIDKCKDSGIPFSNSATTNAYFLKPDKIDLIKKLRFSRFQITLDGPREEHNKVKFQPNCDSAFDHTLKNIREIITHIPELRIVLRINYTKSNFQQELIEQICHAIPETCRSSVDIMLKKVWQESLSDDDYAMVTETAHRLAAREFNVDQSDMISGYVPCYVSRRYYNTINYNGLVYKCTACDDMYQDRNCGHIDETGKIIWENDFEKRYLEPSFMNETCRRCKFLPACYGVCPRDHAAGQSYCKLDAGMRIETKIKNYIDFRYDSITRGISH